MRNSETNAVEDEDESGGSTFGTLVAALNDKIGDSAFELDDWADHLAQINLLLAGITEYGVDATSLVRWGMSRQAWQPLLILLIITPEDVRHDRNSPIDFDGWMAALGLSSLDTAEIPLVVDGGTFNARGPLVERALLLLPRWVQLAPLREILELTPPDRAMFEQVDPEGPASEVRHAYEWLAERSSESNLERWSFASLQNEFRWREDTWVPPFVPEVIETDRATDEALRYELAKQAAALPPDVGLGSEARLLDEMKRQALEFLRVNRFREAAALFEFYIRKDPDNNEAINNLAFCLVPTDPELALHHWESIAQVPFEAATMLAYNRCLAMRLVGRADEALDQAEYRWQRAPRGNEGTAYLWRQVADGLELYHEQDVRKALAFLAAEIAVEVGRPDRQARWLNRADER